jgi:hypothetical protein
MPWKAFFTTGDETYATNALEFETRDEAEKYAHGLYCRWTAVASFGLAEVDAGDSDRRTADQLELIL